MKSFAIQALLAGLMSTLSVNALAQTKSNQQLTNDLSALQQSVQSMQQDMQGLRRLLDNRAMLELFQRVDELADEVSHLRGMLEQQENELAAIKKRQRELYLDIDRRLRELELTGNRQPAATASPPLPATGMPAPAAPTAAPAAAAAPAVPAPAVSAPPAAASPPPLPKPASISTGQSKPRAPVSEERGEYQKAFDMLKEGRYKMANAAFKGFLQKYPQSNYAGNAQYWLGESNYVTRQFEQAITEFSAVVENYPQSNKVPDAMLKLGYTYYELSKFDEARQVLQNLQKFAPNGTAARLAGKRLNRMKREGR